MDTESRVRLWDEINRYVVACRGDPSKYVYGNTPRQVAVAQVEKIVREIEAELTSDALIEVGRKAVEDVLIDMRDARVSMVCGNGLCIREADGSPSNIIRLRTDAALRIALTAMLEARKATAP